MVARDARTVYRVTVHGIAFRETARALALALDAVSADGRAKGRPRAQSLTISVGPDNLYTAEHDPHVERVSVGEREAMRRYYGYYERD